MSGCALIGTVVHAGNARGVVATTGADTEFGKIAAGLSTHQLDTEFQVGLRRFSMLRVYIGGALTTSIFIINVALHKPIMDALLFSLAIAVGITRQLLPAVVSTSLAIYVACSRRSIWRITTTGHGACATTCSLTEPNNMPATAPCPREPTMSRSAPAAAVSRTSAGGPRSTLTLIVSTSRPNAW